MKKFSGSLAAALKCGHGASPESLGLARNLNRIDRRVETANLFSDCYVLASKADQERVVKLLADLLYQRLVIQPPNGRRSVHFSFAVQSRTDRETPGEQLGTAHFKRIWQ
ncbi:hypothetical protein OVA07_13905 [Novosphingobium sp. SL115]|uniref:hypothetical protein n=1 Tax=Novosphingobium sp. SL115 TaxID=2995150 RepID=UPI002272E80B|nr:hypothetical protein [Novosphingobium sp. SL115]MCY1672097.1 hypothetical protein [Novosphingobium sp. SL115]